MGSFGTDICGVDLASQEDAQRMKLTSGTGEKTLEKEPRAVPSAPQGKIIHCEYNLSIDWYTLHGIGLIYSGINP
jgi:hypothetical protein